MDIFESEIKSICNILSKPLKYVAENGVKSYNEFNINCCDLEDYNFIDIRKEGKFIELFQQLAKIKGSCLYFFEINSQHSKDEIIEKIQSYSQTENAKVIPAIKSRVEESKILYLGKVKKSIWARVIQHLGYYKVTRTQGLQLFYWAKEARLDLKFCVYEFDNNMENLMNVVENEMSKKLKPILGKHK